MTNFPRLNRDWNNPCWQPKFWGKRMPRRLKKLFKRYSFYWYEPKSFPRRWVKGYLP